MLALLPDWLDPQQIIEHGGLWLVAAIIFAESGLLIGFFLPGDSLLFITGFLTSKPEGLPHIDQPLPVVLLVLFLAAVIGDQVGYLFGRQVGPTLFDRPEVAVLQPGQRRQGTRLPRTPRPEDDRARAIRADRAHVRPDRRRRRPDEVPHVRDLQRGRRRSCGRSASPRSATSSARSTWSREQRRARRARDRRDLVRPDRDRGDEAPPPGSP